MKKILLPLLLLFCLYSAAQEDDDAIPLNYDLEGLVIESKPGDKITLQNLNFIGGGDKLLPESEPILQELLKIMADNPKLKIQIQGHICCYKKDTSGISRKRAKMIYTYLIGNGIKKRRLSYKGFQGKKPLYEIPEKNEEQKIANRRVEIEIIEN